MKATEDDFLFDSQLTALFHVDEDVRRAAMNLNAHLLDFIKIRDTKGLEFAKNKSNKFQN